MDLEAYIAAHRQDWQRLEVLLSRRRTLTGEEVDELVTLYRRTAAHVSVIRSSAPDAILVDRLSTLVARARSVVTGTSSPAWQDLSRFFLVAFPAFLYRTAAWWVSVAVAFLAVGTAVGAWVATHPDVQSSIAAPAQIRRLVEQDFADYYSQNPAAEFAFGVWTNNAFIAAASLVLGVLVGLPVLFVLWQNAANIGVSGGLMVGHGKADVFFGLIVPHGLLELTAVFVAAGAGLRLGWTLISPGPRPRSRALAEVGRATVGAALGLAVVLAVSGVIEAFVTPSPLPTWARIGIGVLAEVLFFVYVLVLGRRAALAGETGDVQESERGDVVPLSG